MKLTLCFTFMAATSVCVGQESEGYVIRFASAGNSIELAVENTAAMTSSNVSVELTNKPAWASFERSEHNDCVSPHNREPGSIEDL